MSRVCEDGVCENIQPVVSVFNFKYMNTLTSAWMFNTYKQDRHKT